MRVGDWVIAKFPGAEYDGKVGVITEIFLPPSNGLQLPIFIVNFREFPFPIGLTEIRLAPAAPPRGLEAPPSLLDE